MTREEELDWLYRLKSEISVYIPKEWLIPMHDALDAAINSLEQEPKTGHWIENAPEYQNIDPPYSCSECGNMSLRKTDYCDRCGAEMIEP